MAKTAVRFNPIRTMSALAAAGRHARREDAIGRSRVRADATPGAALAWAAHECDARDLVAAFKAHKGATGAMERKGAPLALQAICVVSPDWIDATGGRHDPTNPRNRALFVQARDWAESWAGKGAVVAARLDLDEVGGGVVDLTIVPTRVQRSRGGKETVRISTNAALTDLAESVGEQKSYVAAQTSWSTWAQRTLDPALERGTPRSETKAEHLRPEEYGRVQDELRETRDQAVKIVAAAATSAERVERDARAEAQRVHDAAQRQAATVLRTAQAKADALAKRGKQWVAEMKRKAEEERERILAPMRTWRGRLAFMRQSDEAGAEARIEAARIEAEREAARKVREAEADAQRAQEVASKARREVGAMRSALADVSAQRDAAHADLRRLQPSAPAHDLGRRFTR